MGVLLGGTYSNMAALFGVLEGLPFGLRFVLFRCEFNTFNVIQH